MSLAPRWRWFGVISILTVIADHATKQWALRTLPTDGRGRGIAVSFIDGFWDWRLSYNTGSAFGLFHGIGGARVFLSVVAVLAVGLMAWMVKKTPDGHRRVLCAIGLIAGGAIGNVIDRIWVGKVTDFVVWRYQRHEWPTFNVADVALCVGVGLLLLDLGKREPAAPPPGPRGARTP